MNGSVITGLGEIDINNDVIAKYAGTCAIECFGVVGMAAINVRDGLAKLLKFENLSGGITVSVIENKIKLCLHIIVSYGVNIPSVCENIVENVKYKVETFTGLEVDRIDIFVEGVRVID